MTRPHSLRAPHSLLALCLVLTAGAALAAEPGAAPTSRRYLAASVYEEGGELLFERPGGPAREKLSEWHLVGEPVGRLIGLTQPAPGGSSVRVLDRTGTELGTAAISAGQDAVVTDRGVIAVPHAFHGPVRAHELDFLSLQGKLLRSVSEPELKIAKWSAQADGQLVTVNRGPGEDTRTIVTYAPDGAAVWRYSPSGQDYPDAKVAPDGGRLLVLHQDPGARLVDLELVGPGNQVVARHQLPLLTEVTFSDDSAQIAAVGWGGTVLLDGRSGDILWRNEQQTGVLKGGLRFDPEGKRLLLVEGERRPKANVTALRLRRLRLADGGDEHADIGTVPLDRVPAVRDVEAKPNGERRVVLHDRVLRVSPRAWRAR